MIAQNLPFLLLHHVFLTLPPTFNQRRLDDRKASEAVMTMRSVGGETVPCVLSPFGRRG
jgi:hypothetical protein